MTDLSNIQSVHIIGIGGTGMSAIARILLERGFAVSGSDPNENSYTKSLSELGATIYHRHAASNIGNVDMVIASSAIPESHIEIESARSRAIPVVRRSDIIASVMQGQDAICVAGAHGKTTTTSMIAFILSEAGRDPSYIIGSSLANTGLNAHVGRGKAFVIEADEYGNMFHGLRPKTAVVTNIEYDHPDFFATFGDMIASFAKFIGLLPVDGLLIACADSPTLLDLIGNNPNAVYQVETYGIENPRAKWQARNIKAGSDGGTIFDLYKDNEQAAVIHLGIPGLHNVSNAIAAIIAATNQGVPITQLADIISRFRNSSRRFDIRDELDGIIVVDDYAHHPTAIQTMIDTARRSYPGHDLWCVWQPHTYSRTKELMDEFVTAFEDADHVLITDIFAAREAPIDGITTEAIISRIDHADVRHVVSFEEAVNILLNEVESPSLILIMSAGDAPQIGIDYLKQLQGA